MKENIDFEQLYYDEVYKNKKLQDKIIELQTEIQEMNICRTQKNVDLQKYILLQLKKERGELKDECKNKNKKM